MVKKKKDPQEMATQTEPITIDATTSENNLRTRLDEIKGYDGVVGYILRNTNSATVDLKDPSRIIDYAMIASSAIDATNELSELFELGEPKNIIIYGKKIKMLAITIGQNKISIFMEQYADNEKVLKKLHMS